MSHEKYILMPEWFSLDSYSICGSMGIKAWALALEVREWLLREAKEKSLGQPGHLTESDFLRLLRDFSCNVDAGDTRSVGRLERIQTMPHPTLLSRTVSASTVGILAAYWSDLASNEALAPIADDLVRGYAPEDENLRDRFEAVEHLPAALVSRKFGKDDLQYIDSGGDVMALVELSAPEEVLVKDFREFVREYKKILGIEGAPKTISNNDFKKWHESRVLAYIDLTIWQEYIGKSSTHQQMGIFLFPDEIDVSLDDRIRRTVRPLAQRILSPSYVAAIIAQADTFTETAKR